MDGVEEGGPNGEGARGRTKPRTNPGMNVMKKKEGEEVGRIWMQEEEEEENGWG